jgi:hypothetical protein
MAIEQYRRRYKGSAFCGGQIVERRAIFAFLGCSQHRFTGACLQVFRDGVVLRGTERREYQGDVITFDETARLLNGSGRHVIRRRARSA